MTIDKNFLSVRGKIIKVLRGKTFQVRCDNGKIIIVSVAARFRNTKGGRRANIIEGDRVVVAIPLRDLEKGQIVSFGEE